MGTPEQEIEKLRQAMAVLEEQRLMLGDKVVEPALHGLRQKVAALQSQLTSAPAFEEQAVSVEERRLITVFFSDIVGSTALAESMDPEEWREILSRLQTAIAELVVNNHGVVAQYLGDGLLAYFGAQQASERDPEYAVRAALAAQAAMKGFVLPGDAPVQIRIGIHTGLVVMGAIGAAGSDQVMATGDTVNLAARLQNSAPPGGILITHETFRCVRGVFDLLPQPLLTLKGKRDPVRAYLVQRLRPRAFRLARRGVHEIEASLTGREEELEALRAAYRSAVHKDQEQWAHVSGEPGLGKSRLLDEMVDFLDLRPEPFYLFRSRAYHGESAQPYGLIRRMWLDRFEIAEDAPLAAAESRWVEGFSELYGGRREDSAVEAAHVLGLLAGLEFSASPHLGALRDDPLQLKGRALVVSQELFRLLRQAHPLVFLLEDLQWADPSSLEILANMFLESKGQGGTQACRGVFVLATSRPEWTPPQAVRSSPGYRFLALSALPPEVSRKLARQLLVRLAQVPEDLLGLIAERAEGVPYFIEEMVNWLLDRGVIQASGETWQYFPSQLEGALIPGSLQHLIYARLNALQASERAVLQYGSVFGRAFWTGGLKVLGSRTGEETLESLQRRGFVEAMRESSFEGEREWSFHHNLLREITYDSILRKERARLHQRAGAWLEGQARRAGRLDEFAGPLAMHAEQAGQASLAAGWLIRVGDRARARGATHEARQAYDRALALLPESDRERRWLALLGRSETFSILGLSEARMADMDVLLSMAEQAKDDSLLAEVYYRQGFHFSSLGDDRAAVPAFETSVQAAHQAGNRSLEALVLALESISLNRLGDRQSAEAAAEKGLMYADDPQGDPGTIARILVNASVFYLETGDLSRSIDLLNRAVEANRSVGDRSGEAIALGNLGYNYIQFGLPELAQGMLRRAADLAEKIGHRRSRAYHNLNLGLALWRSGEALAAQQEIGQVLPEMIALGDSFGQAASLSYLGVVLEELGQFSDACLRYDEAQELFMRLGMQAYQMDALAGQARGNLAKGLIGQSVQRARQVWEYLQDPGPAGMEFPIRAYLTCAQVFQAAGEVDQSWTILRAGVQELKKRAERISNLDWRRSFMENIREHRGIIAMTGG